MFIYIKLLTIAFVKARKPIYQMETTQSKFKPLNLVKREDGKVVIVAGKAQIMPHEFDNVEEAENYLKTQPYDVTIYLISTLLYYEKEDKANKEAMEQSSKEAN